MKLLQRIQSSTYLGTLLEAHPEFMPFAQGTSSVSKVMLQTQIETLDKGDEFTREQTRQRSEKLRISKQRFALLWSIAELSASISFEELGGLQSAFAERSIQVALDITWHSKNIAQHFINSKDTNPTEAGIFLLALGKLGGSDLNFSSDIDLIAFFDKEKLQLAPMKGASYVVTQCLNGLSKVLSEQNAAGFVWRVDWRLRPYAALRNLSMVSEKALDFYHYQARPWHRLAMLKARPVAGNLALGRAFLNDLRSFLWRHNLDYRAIDDIAQLKAKINLEHPDLQGQRSSQNKALDQGRGFNLKLGHGGIREIEFMVNALQLLWGGRKPSLRITNTLRALEQLGQEKILKKSAVETLAQAYVFLRRAENHLQMLENAQQYHIPQDADALASFLALCEVKDWAAFNHLLTEHRIGVYSLFTELLTEKDTQSDGKDPYIWQSATCSEKMQEIVQSWEAGFLIYGVSEGQAHHFEPLLRALSSEIGNSGCALETAIQEIDNYFSLLPPGGQYFRLLRDYPWLLEKIIAPILLSPTMASLLHQSPHIIDRFLEETQAETQALDTTIVFSNPDYEYRLENLRRLANEELYLRYSCYFEGQTDVLSLQQRLTTLAESLLDAAIEIACDEMGLDEPPIAIVGMGKLGSVGMMPKSDLDLVYLCESMETHALASKFSSRLNTIINSPMREGRVYELDTRLRPSGQSGSVTISLQSYQQHQLNRAHTWSHLALVPARVVAGNAKVGRQFTDIKREILSTPRDVQQFKFDCAKMLKRVQDQRIVSVKADQFSVKLRPGGLFELEYLLNCIAIPHYIENPSAINLEFKGLLDELAKQHGKDLLRALKCLQAFQLEIRLFGHDDMRFDELPGPILAHVLKTLQCDSTNALIEDMAQSIDVSKRLIDQFFKEIDWGKLNAWDETPVLWTDAAK